MQTTTPLEQTLLTHLRQLPLDKQQAVLDFAEFLRQGTTIAATPTTPPSLQQLAKLPRSQRHQLLAPFIANTAEDFKTDPALTEFSVH